VAEDYPELSVGCYPFQKDGVYGANIVVRGTEGAQVDAAMVRLAKELQA
jgi:hypothetical protein